MTDLMIYLESLKKGVDIFLEAKDRFQKWASKAHGRDKEQLRNIRSYVVEWSALVIRLKAYAEKARIMGEDHWPSKHKEKIQQLGEQIAGVGIDVSPLLGLSHDYRDKHHKLYKALVFKFSSEGVGADEFDSEEETIFPQSVTLSKFIEWIDFLDLTISDALEELNKHIEEGCKGCQ
jgi:hypothetical protein